MTQSNTKKTVPQVTQRNIFFTTEDFAYIKHLQADYFYRTGDTLTNSKIIARLIDLHRNATAKFQTYQEKQQADLKDCGKGSLK